MNDLSIEEIDAELKRRGIDPTQIDSSDTMPRATIPEVPQQTGNLLSLAKGEIPAGLSSAAQSSQSFLSQALHDKQSGNLKFPLNFGGDILAGLGYAAQGLHNAPVNLTNMVSPGAAKSLAQFLPKKNLNMSEIFGVPKPSTLDQITQGAAQFAPYAPLSAFRIGAAGLGGLYGLTQSEYPAIDGPLGAIFGVGSKYLGKAIASGGNSILNRGAQTALGQSLIKSIEDAKNYMSPAEAYLKGISNYKDTKKLEGIAHKDLDAKARGIDILETPYDDSSYKNAIGNKIQKLQKQSESDPISAPRNDVAIQKLIGAYNADMSTLSGALGHARALNSEYADKLPTDYKLPFKMIKFAKGQLEKNIDENIKLQGLDSYIGKTRELANNATQQRVGNFEEITKPSGSIGDSKFLEYAKTKDIDPAQGGAFINQYIPSKNNTGVENFDRLTGVMRSKPDAVNLIKSSYFKDVIDKNGELLSTKFYRKYMDLSDPQKKYLFTQDERRSIDDLLSVSKLNNQQNKKTLLGLVFNKTPIVKDLASTLSDFVSEKIAGNPKMSRFAINQARRNVIGNKKSGRLSPLITPQAIGNTQNLVSQNNNNQ